MPILADTPVATEWRKHVLYAVLPTLAAPVTRRLPLARRPARRLVAMRLRERAGDVLDDRPVRLNLNPGGRCPSGAAANAAAKKARIRLQRPGYRARYASRISANVS